jgi:Co/Zn/Cd efflux system component
VWSVRALVHRFGPERSYARGVNGTLSHRHGLWSHEHHHHGPHRHARLPFRSAEEHDGHVHEHEHDDHGHDDHGHEHGDHAHEGHGHTHGLVDRSIVRSRAGVRAVSASLGVLGLTAALQLVVFVLSGSVALLADLIHNGGDALTAIPLAIAFLARSERGERLAGYFVVATIFVSAAVAAVESVDRLVHPHELNYLLPLAVAGLVGFVGNEVAARIRLEAGRRLQSPALVADGHHARVDGFVSLGVVASALFVWAGVKVADPLVGLAITALILRITWQAWRTIRTDDST